jgi:hypothetical protein
MVRDVCLAVGRQILQQAEPLTLPVLAVAKEGPKADEFLDIETDDGQREPTERCCAS